LAQLLDEAEAEYFPDEQLKQAAETEAPAVLEYVPAAHFVHAVAPATDWNVPTEQLEHAEAPPAE
jgi:hypothetical protein